MNCWPRNPNDRIAETLEPLRDNATPEANSTEADLMVEVIDDVTDILIETSG